MNAAWGGPRPRPRLVAAETPNDPEHERHQARLQALLAAHGDEVTVMSPANPARDVWRGFVPMGKIPGRPEGTIVPGWDLGELMDQLDEIYPPSIGRG